MLSLGVLGSPHRSGASLGQPEGASYTRPSEMTSLWEKEGYTWAAYDDISPVAVRLDVVVSGTAPYIGSGSALAVSTLASAVHVAKTGRLATYGQLGHTTVQ